MKVSLASSIVALVYCLVSCSAPQGSYTRANHAPKPYIAELGLVNKTIVYRSRALSISTINHIALALFESKRRVNKTLELKQVAAQDIPSKPLALIEPSTDFDPLENGGQGNARVAEPLTPLASKPVDHQKPANIIATDMTRVLERYFAQVTELPAQITVTSSALKQAREAGAEFLLVIQPLREVNRHVKRQHSRGLNQLNPLRMFTNSHLQLRIIVFDVTSGKMLDTATVAARTGILTNRQAYSVFGEQALTAYAEQLIYQPQQRTVY